MNDKKSIEMFSKAPVHKAVLNNALPAMLAMLMVLVYNLADTFLSDRPMMHCRWQLYLLQHRYS